MSGAFLAHGYQANRILALDAPGTMVHAMGKEAAARVTRRTVEALEDARRDDRADVVFDGLVCQTRVARRTDQSVDADAPSAEQIEQVRQVLSASIRSARDDKPGLSHRLQSDTAKKTRAASVEVRRRLAEQWDAA